jgi:uncharacterized membrane protein YjfL (UPF0719 family)
MKKTTKLFVLSLLEVLCVAIIPLVIVYIGYGGWGEEAKNFKLGFGVLIFLIVVFMIVKRVIITPWQERQKIKTGNLLAQLEIETDKGKIENIESALKQARVIETVFTWILPIAFLITAFFASKAMERAIVQFSGILLFVGISEFFGFIFAIARALCVHSKHK